MSTGQPLHALNLLDDLVKACFTSQGVLPEARDRALCELSLKRRYQDLGFQTLAEYRVYFEAHANLESKELLDKVKRGPLGFFKNIAHFEWLAGNFIPQITEIILKRNYPELKVWVPECGRGHELYSLALFLHHQLPAEIKLSFLGTDRDPAKLEIAKNGFFARSEIREIPLPMMGDFWQRSVEGHVEGMKAKSALSQMMQFLPETSVQSAVANFAKPDGFDLIFSRTRLMEMEDSERKKRLAELIQNLKLPEGCLFTGVTNLVSEANPLPQSA